MPSFSLNGTARHGTAYRNINRRKNRRAIPTAFGLQTEIFAHIRSVTAASLYIDFIPCLGFNRGKRIISKALQDWFFIPHVQIRV